MNSIIARAAFRTAARQTVQQRQFSVVQSLRQFARSFEHAPFERLPTASNPAAADWGRQMKKIGSQAVVYFPLGAALLGWPYAAATLLDGHM